MNKQIEEKLPESLLEVIGFEYCDDGDEWTWLSNDGLWKAIISSTDIKYVTMYTVERNEDGEIEDCNIFDEYSVGEFIDRYIFKSVE